MIGAILADDFLEVNRSSLLVMLLPIIEVSILFRLFFVGGLIEMFILVCMLLISLIVIGSVVFIMLKRI
jgi:hypothetical protein